MSWGFPFSFFLLLGAIPLIVLLNTLGPKGHKVSTTTLFLWERVLKKRPMGKRFGRLLKKNLLLILQILIALILIAALADPWLLHQGGIKGDIVAVVDLSASMKAKALSGSRFEAARKELLSLIDAIPTDQRMMVIGAGPTPRVLSPFTADKKRLKNLASTVQPTDAPAQVKEAILFAHSFLKRGSHDRVIVFSDGAFDGANQLPWGSPHLRLVGIDGKNHNVGITGFDLRRLPARPLRYEIMVSVRNFSSRSVRAPLDLKIGGRSWTKEQLNIPAHENQVLIYPYRGPLEGRLTARLDIQDDFLTDNLAFLFVPESSPVRVLYVGKGNPFLERLFRSMRYVQVTSEERWAPEDSSQRVDPYDVVILDGIPSPSLTEGNFILINTVAKGMPLEVRGKLSGPRVLPAVTRDPLMEGLRLDDLYIREALHLVPKGEGVTLARSGEGPLIVAFQRGRLKTVVLGFDLLATDLPFRVAFPIFFTNVFDWFHPQKAEFPAVGVQAGSPYALRLGGKYGQVEVRSPSGRSEMLGIVSNPASFAKTWDVGFYTFKTGNRQGEFAVNLFSEKESRITSQVSLRAQEKMQANKGEAEGIGEKFSLWPYLLTGVFVLLLVEGFLLFRGGGSFFPLAFRFVALSVIGLAIVNPKIFKGIDALDVVVGVDVSRSVGQEGKEEALQILEKSRGVHPTGRAQTRTGLLFFGRRPVWEFFPRRHFKLGDFSPDVNREETDIQAALQAALAQIGENRQGRILLISDGNENRGEISPIMPLLRSHGVPVWVLPVNSSRGGNEVYLSDIVLPPEVDSAEGFEVRGAIESRYKARARIKLLRDGVIHKEKAIALKSGTNWVRFKETLRKRGSHTFELLVESADDTLAENNLLQGVVKVKGPPRVLYLHSKKDSRRFFARALAVEGYSVVEISPEESALSLAELSAFDLLVMDNVPAYRLPRSKMEAIEKYVRDLGGGLMVVGGSQSYGAGGYYKTPLERILPVIMRPPSRLDLPQVALLFVLDKSGSMGEGPEEATKLELAKAAALVSADLMNPTDHIGILAFDAQWNWVLPFRRVGKGEWLSAELSSLQSDGGTDLHRAMIEAYRSFSAKDAAIKHLLILSDGLTQKADFHSLVEEMVRGGITVSTVAVGRDANLTLMARIARDGKGRFYRTSDPRTIPQIFTTETLLISRDVLVERLAYPRVMAAVGPLRGFRGRRIPPVRGYILTHPKPRADVLMKVEKDPLLVSWRYGLGKVVAFTSDLSGQWGRDWLKWKDFPRLAGQLARSAMKKVSENRIRTELKQEDEEVRTVVDLMSRRQDYLNHLGLVGNLTTPNQAALERSFRQIAPGRYASRFPISRRGVHFLTIFAKGKKGEESRTVTTVPFIVPYPREYRELKPNMTLLSRLAEETNGEVLDTNRMEEGIKHLFTPDPGKGTTAQETWWPISGLGLFLFLADLALRKLPRKQRV